MFPGGEKTRRGESQGRQLCAQKACLLRLHTTNAPPSYAPPPCPPFHPYHPARSSQARTCYCSACGFLRGKRLPARDNDVWFEAPSSVLRQVHPEKFIKAYRWVAGQQSVLPFEEVGQQSCGPGLGLVGDFNGSSSYSFWRRLGVMA